MSSTLPLTAPHDERRAFAGLCLTAPRIVFGDIGTSPLYALRECFHGPHGVPTTPENVLGVLSLVTWALVLVVGAKYLLYVLRADNEGEGGILALMALALPADRAKGLLRAGIVALGLFGAALLWGDGMITPAISVLSAVEGLEVVAPALDPFVVPITVAILAGLFLVQRWGTERVGGIFGPVTLLWFVVLAILGVASIVEEPDVLRALSPTWAVAFLAGHGGVGVVVLGAVFLVVTGGEALYADLGHLGRRPIVATWFALVFPALLLNYLGQGALLLRDPAAAEAPFFLLAPRWALVPLVALAAAATIIASQAVISATFSLARQAVNLGYSPRLAIVHTSRAQVGQIYVPAVNAGLFVCTVLLVLGFGSSSALAGAYGIAVALTMAITSILAGVVALRRWGWPPVAVFALTLALLVVDGAFLAANLLKLVDGGWVPLGVAALVYVTARTWKRGRELLGQRLRERVRDWDTFEKLVAEVRPTVVPGCALYLTSLESGAPPALVQNVAHNHVLHARTWLVTVQVEDVARVAAARRFEVLPAGTRFRRLVVHCGFFEQPDLTSLLALPGSPVARDVAAATFVLGRETVVAGSAATSQAGHAMAPWREELFAFLSRNAQWAIPFFGLPPARVLEIGQQVEL